MNEDKINLNFPSLLRDGFTVTSPFTPNYNCIAWAIGDNTRWWWPDKNYICYWPPNITREENIESFIKAFQSIGYEICDSDDLEQYYEKIAIFTEPNTGKPTHAAKQLLNGNWTSKLGQSEDIEHKLKSLAGPVYGSVFLIMKRKNKS